MLGWRIARTRVRVAARQVLLVDRETLEAMDLRPGVIRENITTDGMDVNSLALKQELRIGEVRLQVSEICHPCDQLEKVRPGLRRELRGRRGMLCRVLEGGIFVEAIPLKKFCRR